MNLRFLRNCLSPLGSFKVFMDFLSGFIEDTQKEVVEEVQQLVEEKGIKKQVLDEAKKLAQTQAMHIMDPELNEPVSFPGIPLETEEDEIEFRLVLEYLESIGLKFTPTVLRYESQNPSYDVNAPELAEKLHLRNYDKTPLLVQLIEERLQALEK